MRILEDMPALGLTEGEVLVKKVGKTSWPWGRASRPQEGLEHRFRSQGIAGKTLRTGERTEPRMES